MMTLNAFGPFHQQTSIDFERLATGGLFLITGPTGSGKTTIFDALTFALYGSTSGEVRESDSLKSHYASDEEVSYVKLEFEINQEIYHVTRYPAQIRPTKTNLLRQHHQEISFESRHFNSTKLTEVNEYILKLINLNADQFRKIVLLPQGEFVKLLFASSREKENIFRHLFKTQDIEAFQATLTEKTKQYREEVDKSKYFIQSLIKDIAIDEVDQVITDNQQQMDQLKKELQLNQTQLKTLEKEKNIFSSNLSLFNDYQLKQEKRKELSDLKPSIEEKKLQLNLHHKSLQMVPFLEKLNDNQQNIDKNSLKEQQLQSEITQLNQNYQQVVKDLQVKKKKYDSLDSYYLKINEYQSALEKQRQAKTLRQELKDVLRELKSLINQQTLSKQTLTTLSQQQVKHQEDLKKLDDLRNKQNDLQSLLLKLSEEKIEVDKQVERLSSYLELKKNLKSSLKQFDEISLLLKQKNEQYEHSYHQFHESLAGVIAQTLKEGKPCPVCGSLDHPQLASLHENHVDKETLEALDKELMTHKSTYERLSLQISEMRQSQSLYPEFETMDDSSLSKLKAKQSLIIQRIDEISQEIQQNKEVLSKENTHRDLLSTKSQKLNEEKMLLNDISKDILIAQNNFMKLTNSLKELIVYLNKPYEAMIEQTTQEIESIRSDYQLILDTQQQIQTTLTSKEQSLKNTKENQEDLNQVKEKLTTQIEAKVVELNLDKDFEKHLIESSLVESYQQEITDYEILHQLNKEQLKDLSTKLEGLDQAMLQQQVVDHEMQIVELNKQNEITSNNIALTQDLLSKLVPENKSMKESLRNYQQYFELSQIASGSKQTQYLSFERYVLSITFEKVLQAANVHLYKMTEQRYTFLLANESKGRGAKGLEIGVLDYYTSTTRMVTTLSGGEQFKASLSLALGLSDVMSAMSGGYRINTLFIDEGFGSLDNVSLDSAIDTLMSLNESGRMVGMISHVDELKSRITNQIEVIKSSKGSQLEIHYE